MPCLIRFFAFAFVYEEKATPLSSFGALVSSMPFDPLAFAVRASAPLELWLLELWSLAWPIADCAACLLACRLNSTDWLLAPPAACRPVRTASRVAQSRLSSRPSSKVRSLIDEAAAPSFRILTRPPSLANPSRGTCDGSRLLARAHTRTFLIVLDHHHACCSAARCATRRHGVTPIRSNRPRP